MKIIIPWNGIGINKKLLYRIAYNMCDAKIVWNHLHNPVAPPFPWKYQACNNKAYNYKEQEKACEPQKPLFLNKKSFLTKLLTIWIIVPSTSNTALHRCMFLMSLPP